MTPILSPLGCTPEYTLPNDAACEKTARVASEFLRQAREELKDKRPAISLILRGFVKLSKIATMQAGTVSTRSRSQSIRCTVARAVGGHDRRRAGQDPDRSDERC